MAAISARRAEALKQEWREIAQRQRPDASAPPQPVIRDTDVTLAECLEGWDSLPVLVVEKLEKRSPTT